MRRKLAVPASVTALAALAFGGVKLAGAVRDKQSYEQLLEAFIYKLGQISGHAFGRLSIADDEALSTQEVLKALAFKQEFEIKVQDPSGADVRWLKAHFQTSNNTGIVVATLRGDNNTLPRLATWLQEKAYSTFTKLQLGKGNTELIFWLNDSQYIDVAQKIRAINSRLPGTPIDPPHEGEKPETDS